MKQSYLNQLSIYRMLEILTFLIIPNVLQAQQEIRIRPRWYFGQSIGLNLNSFQGNAQDLNELTYIPTPFTTGSGLKPYASLYVEYFPKKSFGVMLNLAYDHRGGNFTEVLAPCDCPENLRSHLAYAAIEPSLKFVPFKNGFYVFAGPTLLLSLNKGFTYTQLYQTDVHADFGQVVDPQFGAQGGIGYDIALSDESNVTQLYLSPFISAQTNLLPSTRVRETWNIQTIRTGVILKFGSIKKAVELVRRLGLKNRDIMALSGNRTWGISYERYNTEMRNNGKEETFSSPQIKLPEAKFYPRDMFDDVLRPNQP
jgi:hypothetical protein